MSAFLVLLVCVLAIDGREQLQHDRATAEQDLAREQELLGRALRPSVLAALRDGGPGDAREFLRETEAGETTVALALVSMRSALTASATEFRREGAGRVVTRVPIESADGAHYALVLTQSLAGVASAIRRRAIRIAGIALAMLFGAGTLAVIVGDRLVGRRVRAMVAETRRISSGAADRSLRSTLRTRRDELGDLEVAIAELSRGLDDARERAEVELEARIDAERKWFHGARLAAVGTLAAGVAHELGTPLQVVSGRARMICESAEVPKKYRTHAETVRSQVASMERTVRSMLRLARAEPALDVDVQLDVVVRETIDSLAPLADSAAVELRAGTIERAPMRGDPEHLRHLVVNLVQNGVQAAKASPSAHSKRGCVEVGLSTLSSERVAVPRGARADVSSWIRLEFRDNGPGIPASLRSRIFDPFFTTKDVGEGTGMGLSVANGIAHEHGGWIDFDASGGTSASRGARFWVYLPLNEART